MKKPKELFEIPTQMTKFPCPKCGKYYEPYLTRKDGKALCECPKCGLYETSIAVSKNFRKFCQKLGSAPNREPTYYTSSEERVKRYLEHNGLREGLDFFHNNRVLILMNEKRRYFWPDFVIPSKKLIIGASPHIWHMLWSRNGADERFSAYMKSLGWKVIHLDEKDLNALNKRRTRGKKLGFNPEAKPYERPKRCKELDEIFGVIYEINKEKIKCQKQQE